MSDLTRLNPTPHAIAVYASQPPSPVTTQHSLPSGRCPLLGPDFHRLDRYLAHLFDHLVGANRIAVGSSIPITLAVLIRSSSLNRLPYQSGVHDCNHEQ